MSCSNKVIVFNIMVNNDKLSNRHKYNSGYKYGFEYEYGVGNEYSIGNKYRYDSSHEYGISHEYSIRHEYDSEHKYSSEHEYNIGGEYGSEHEYSIGHEYGNGHKYSSLNEHDSMDKYDNMNEHNSMNEHDSGSRDKHGNIDKYHNYEPEKNITKDANNDYEIQKVFNSWDVAIEEIEKYACRKGFGTRRLYVEKLENGDVQRHTIVCEHFGCPEQTKSKNPQNKTTSKCIGCTWQINISCLEKENPYRLIYVTKIVDKHKNHELNLPYRTFQESFKFSEKMLKNIEFYVKKMNCSLQQICKALEESYPEYTIYMPVL
ncbi:24586_t:CDS:2 [Cetraspora pellucida]|uniref:24586_t:CDS:1 n=1 Tax=Cetraspora pellucida TaxID=1433469 RepID=A0A9N9P344_9GLOM|nr:24586_t:CDS:2 [Cetraspora pellucida]